MKWLFVFPVAALVALFGACEKHEVSQLELLEPHHGGGHGEAHGAAAGDHHAAGEPAHKKDAHSDAQPKKAPKFFPEKAGH